jgi:hypothetical protein
VAGAVAHDDRALSVQDCEPWITSPNSDQDLPVHFSNCIARIG